MPADQKEAQPINMRNSSDLLEAGRRIRDILGILRVQVRPIRNEIPFIIQPGQAAQPPRREIAQAFPRRRENPLVGEVTKLLTAFAINQCYRVYEENGKVCIRESSNNPPNESSQARFKQMLKQHLAGEHVARFFQKKGLNVPAWEIFPASTPDEIWNFFSPHLQKEYRTLYEYAILSMQCLGQGVKQGEEKDQLGVTFQGPLLASLPTIPVSFPDTPDSVFDLCEEVLKLIPERDGKIRNPLTNQVFPLEELTLRKDVLDILADRIQAQESPAAFIDKLKNLQGNVNAELAPAVIQKLNTLKPSQHEKLSSYLSELPLEQEEPFSKLLAVHLLSLTENIAIDEFEARYGIRSQSIECKDGEITFSFTDENYQNLLKEYGNKSKLLPLTYHGNKSKLLPLTYQRVDNNMWKVTLTLTEYQQMVQDNQTNVLNFLQNFIDYQAHLIQSESSRFKRKILTQTDLNTKKQETAKLIKILTGNSLEETDAKKLIAFRKALPEAAKKLNARRDEWLWWVMKFIVTGLTLGSAYCCYGIWEVEGQKQVNEAEKILRPKRS
ncbi:MAG: hypothetical protein K0S63_214 [Gammaproteobacteria bacterium]|nr:hypothetical protein [Gammaproteobacteria bacterium]